MFILYTWFVTTEEHFDMVVGSSVREFSIKRWAWGLFFYSVIKVPNAFYLLNPTPRIVFSIRLFFPHKNAQHHHYVHRPCRRAKVDIWPWMEGLEISGVHILGFALPLLLKYCTEVPFSFSFFQNKFGLKLLSFRNYWAWLTKRSGIPKYFLANFFFKKWKWKLKIVYSRFKMSLLSSFESKVLTRSIKSGWKKIFSGLKPPARASWILSADKKITTPSSLFNGSFLLTIS